MKFLFACLIAACPVAALADDSIWPGDYAGDCGNKLQCIVEITETGERIDVALIVANRVNFDDVKCRLDGTFSRTAMLGISGKLRGANDVVIVRKRDGVEISGIPKKVCGTSLNKKYEMFGD